MGKVLNFSQKMSRQQCKAALSSPVKGKFTQYTLYTEGLDDKAISTMVERLENMLNSRKEN